VGEKASAIFRVPAKGISLFGEIEHISFSNCYCVSRWQVPMKYTTESNNHYED
jgi:hypothetical protein